MKRLSSKAVSAARTETITRIALLSLLLAATCTPATRCRDDWSIPADSLQRRIDSIPAERAAFVETLTASLPPEGRAAVENLFDDGFETLRAEQANGAEIWSFRYEKCPGCGWYRAGYVAVRGCRIVFELETSDEM